MNVFFAAMDELDELADAVRKRPEDPYPRIRALNRTKSWRRRPLARWVVWFFCVAGIFGAPVHALRAFDDYHYRPPYGDHWGNEFTDAIFTLFVGVGCLLYDRWRVRRDRVIEEGLCPTCGYDLRATPEKCPECGTRGWAPTVKNS